MKSSRKAHYLQISAFLVAVFRYMAMGGMAIGHNMFDSGLYGYQIFIFFEVISWGAMAVLEGFAMPYISKGMKQFPVKSFYWCQLLVYRIILLAAIPLLGAPLYAAVSRNSTIEEVLSVNYPALYWGWLILFAGLVALIVDAVGVVDELPKAEEELPDNQDELESIAWGILSKYKIETGGEFCYPPELVRRMDNRITESQASQIISGWYKATHTRAGAKPKNEVEFVEKISLNGHGG